jgi:hypothetical protein
LKPLWWGSPLVQGEKHQEKEKVVIREEITIQNISPRKSPDQISTISELNLQWNRPMKVEV